MQNLCNKEKTWLDYSKMFHCMVLGNNTTNLNPMERNNFPMVKQKVYTYSCVSTQMKPTGRGE